MDKIIDKSYKTYNYFSRYTSFPYYYNVEDKKYVYGTTSQMNPDIIFTLHKVKRNDTLDSLALNYYNNPTFFWAIASFNNIIDPYAELEEGIELKIPTLSDISFEGE